MKFYVKKEDINSVLLNSNSFTLYKNLNTVLQNILLVAKNNKLTVKATNFQTTFIAEIEANIIEEGSTTVSSKKLSEIVKELQEGDIYIENIANQLIIKSHNSIFKLPTIDPISFPKNEDVKPEISFNISKSKFIKMLKKVAFCISNNINKLEYGGAHMNLFANNLEISSADYQRIATIESNTMETFPDEIIINIPKKTISDVLRIFETKKTLHEDNSENEDNESIINIQTDKNVVIFNSDGKIIISKLIDKYINNLTRLFNNEYKIEATVNSSSLYKAIKCVSPVTNEITNGVLLNFRDNVLEISSLQSEYGTGTDIIEDVTINVEEFRIVFNSRHILDIIQNLDLKGGKTFQNLKILMNSPITPALIIPEEEKLKYLLVPISI